MVVVSNKRKYVSGFETLPFQTDRVNSAPEGLIVVNYTLLTLVVVVVRQSPEARCGGQSPLGTCSKLTCNAMIDPARAACLGALMPGPNPPFEVTR